MKYSRIIGTGGYLPEKTLSNHDLEKIMDTSDTWIRERTGISKRHIAAGDETACDLAEIAASRAMEVAGRTPRQIDLIVLATPLAWWLSRTRSRLKPAIQAIVALPIVLPPNRSSTSPLIVTVYDVE